MIHVFIDQEPGQTDLHLSGLEFCNLCSEPIIFVLPSSVADLFAYHVCMCMRVYVLV